jgi:hypothetical protein
MNAAELLELAAVHGLQITPNGDRLKLKAPAPPPQELVDLIRQHRAELLDYLHHHAAPVPSVASNSPETPTEPAALDSLTHLHRRCYRALLAITQQQRDTLSRGGYDPAGANVFLGRWHRVILNRLDLSFTELLQIQADLQQAGLIQIDRLRLFISQGDGTPQPQADHEPEQWGDPADRLAWGPDAQGQYTGRAFIHWLDGWH